MKLKNKFNHQKINIMAKNNTKTFKVSVTKIGNGIIYCKENKQVHQPDLTGIVDDCRIFAKEALVVMKENETYQVTVSVTKIK